MATQSELAGRLGRSREALAHPLRTLVRAGFLLRDEDVFRDRRPLHRVADPIVRFLRLVVEPARTLLDEGRWEPVWDRAKHRLDAQIYGPHLESVVRRWALQTYAPPDGDLVGRVGSAILADPVSRAPLEVDVVALAPAEDGTRQQVLLLGEVKWSAAGFAVDAVTRLERARGLLAASGYDTNHCQLALFSRDLANTSGPELAIDLATLYDTNSVSVSPVQFGG